jgi:hypothetical protein
MTLGRFGELSANFPYFFRHLARLFRWRDRPVATPVCATKTNAAHIFASSRNPTHDLSVVAAKVHILLSFCISLFLLLPYFLPFIFPCLFFFVVVVDFVNGDPVAARYKGRAVSARALDREF